MTAISAFAQTGAKRVARDQVVAEKQDFARSTKIALVVGVGNYPQGSGLNRLNFPAKDARQVASALQEQGYLVRVLTDQEAIRGSVRRALQELSQAVDPNEGTILFYFSGHGFAFDNINYLATYGTTVDDLKSEGLALTDVEKVLKDSGAKRQLMFIDACRNEPAVGGKTVGANSFVADRRTRLEQNTGLRILYSTRSGSVSYENQEFQQGLYTHFLLAGLSGDASGYSREDRQPDGIVSFLDLSQFMVDRMRSHGVEKGQMQIPYEAGESTGDFIVTGKTLTAAERQKVEAAGATLVASVQPPAARPNTPANNPAPANSGEKRAGIGTISDPSAGATKLANLSQAWRNTVNNAFYSFRFDDNHLYISEKSSNAVVADLTLKKEKNGKEWYEGTSKESSCPGNTGAMEVRSWSTTRIEARIEVPTNPQQPSCGKVFGFGGLRSWTNVVYIPE